MRFLEKDLESLIYNHYEGCYARGFTALGVKNEAELGIWLRQVNLAPYGVADLIHIKMNQSKGVLNIDVIECKLDSVDGHTYAQARRYVQALAAFNYCSVFRVGNEWPMIDIRTVLVGRKANMSGDVGFMCEADATCSVFTYSYGVDGIEFKQHIPELGIREYCAGADRLVRQTDDYIKAEVAAFDEKHRGKRKFEANFLPF